MSFMNNMKLGTKLMVIFILLVVLIGGALGGLSYYNITQLSAIVTQITAQNVPSVKNATGVERYALRTIMDEKMYLLNANDANVNVATYQTSAMANIDLLNKSLDEVDKVATKYNDQALLAKSKEVRTVVATYKQNYNDGVAALQANNLFSAPPEMGLATKAE